MSDETSQESKPTRRPLREDPLSLVLIAAAVLLTVVYFWDKRTRETLQEHMAMAESIQANFRVDSGRCTVGSADEGGRTLVFACTGIAPDEVARAAAASATVRDSIDSFDSALFRSPDASLSCPARPDSWPDACSQYPAERDSTSNDSK